MAFRRRGTQMLLILVAVVLVATTVGRSPAGTLPPPDRPECRHDTVLWIQFDDHSPPVPVRTRDVTLSNYKTAIPEFHDCQRLLITSKLKLPVGITKTRLSYGPLAAVYASSRLDTLEKDFKEPNPRWARQGGFAPARLAEGNYAVAVATVLSYDGAYSPLGIKQGFNCLYLRLGTGGRHQSWLLPNDKNASCAPALLVSQLTSSTSAKALEVKPYSVAGLGFDDYPPSARWDWDPKNYQQYIGLKCGSAWCEIGPPGFAQSIRYTAPAGYTSNTERRVFEVKGWYDEQYLSVYDARADRIKPSQTFGTVFPDPTLDARVFPGDITAPAAIIVVSNDQNGYYKSKWDFAPMSGSNANRLVLTKHNAKWQAIVHPPGGPAAAPRQVEYRDHYADIKAGGGFTIPGNARWRWVATDERIWVGCDVGCCEAIE